MRVYASLTRTSAASLTCRHVHTCAATLARIGTSTFRQWIDTSPHTQATERHQGKPTHTRGNADRYPLLPTKMKGNEAVKLQPTLQAKSSRLRVKPAGEEAVDDDHRAAGFSRREGNKAEPLSKRKQFRSIYVPKDLLDHLDAQEAGWRHGRRRPDLTKEDDWKHVCSETPIWRGKLEFLGAAKTPESFVPSHTGVKEVCFIGRSNVGKSSLINALSRSKPARTEDKPGVTKTVNFYALERSSLNVVDLPGYGFAFAKEDDQNEWQETVATYLSKRTSLKRVFVLLDARHGIKQIDADFLKRLDGLTPARYQLVLTKCDLVPIDDLGRRLLLVQQTLNDLPGALKEVLTVSATSRAGVRALRKSIMNATSLRPGRSSAPTDTQGSSSNQPGSSLTKRKASVRHPAELLAFARKSPSTNFSKGITGRPANDSRHVKDDIRVESYSKSTRRAKPSTAGSKRGNELASTSEDYDNDYENDYAYHDTEIDEEAEHKYPYSSRRSTQKSRAARGGGRSLKIQRRSLHVS
eukprot:m.79745 g.79745  ORF g.79745 m.79745 type:complete len:524 (-) comp14177_c0_seq2:197-1768(-)